MIDDDAHHREAAQPVDSNVAHAPRRVIHQEQMRKMNAHGMVEAPEGHTSRAGAANR
jgi:hypothetical protein